jgi:hypothetical protein
MRRRRISMKKTLSREAENQQVQERMNEQIEGELSDAELTQIRGAAGTPNNPYALGTPNNPYALGTPFNQYFERFSS